jgi:WD40 repeat protein
MLTKPQIIPLIFIIVFALVSCNPGSSPENSAAEPPQRIQENTQSHTPPFTSTLGFTSTNTYSPSNTASSSPTQTPSKTQTVSSAPTSTLAGLLPGSLSMITSGNANQVSQLTRWGKGFVNSVSWSPNGEILAVASSIGIYLYETESLQEIGFIETNAYVYQAVFSPDGSLLASASQNQTVKL